MSPGPCDSAQSRSVKCDGETAACEQVGSGWAQGVLPPGEGLELE